MVESVPCQTADIVAMDKFPCFEQTIGKFGSERLCCVLVQYVFFPSGNATDFQAAYRGAAAAAAGLHQFLEKFYQILVFI